MLRSLLVLSLLMIACGGKEPAPSSPMQASSAEPAPPPSSSTVAEPAPEPKKRKPYEIVNNCNEAVAIALGEDGKGGKQTLAPGASVEGTRDAQGNQTIWLLDAKDQQLVKVLVTRGMGKVAIGKSCRTLDAR